MPRCAIKRSSSIIGRFNDGCPRGSIDSFVVLGVLLVVVVLVVIADVILVPLDASSIRFVASSIARAAASIARASRSAKLARCTGPSGRSSSAAMRLDSLNHNSEFDWLIQIQIVNIHVESYLMQVFTRFFWGSGLISMGQTTKWLL